MKTIFTKSHSFTQEWNQILNRSNDLSRQVEKTVRDVLDDVRAQGDAALVSYTRKFDQHLISVRDIEVSREEKQAAQRRVTREERDSLQAAIKRIREFHQRQAKQLPKSWSTKNKGILVGERVSPLERVGIYVPGGLAAYPSTVLMNAIPAQVAGVSEIIMCTPWPKGDLNPHTLVAADMVGIKRIFKVGGAQAVAAMAYGTKTIPAVDKIVGPGNIYVATAKRLVFGKVGIDMVAGPTEIVVIADDSAKPDCVASDLLSQAEHDPMAIAVLITPSQKLATKVEASLKEQVTRLKRGEIIAKALEGQGTIVITRDLKESAKLSNQFAPEHLSLQVKKSDPLLKEITNAGAVFLGTLSPVAFGDYLAGPNHVLPTSGSGRFSSPLGVYDFTKRSSLISVSSGALGKLGPHVIRLANLEKLTAHAHSVEMRQKRG